MKNIFIAVCLVVVLEGVFAAKECNLLLNCKVCKDETHCESCLDGYVLDSNSVCVLNCSEKFGSKCKYCNANRCICEKGQEWNKTEQACVDIKDCSKEDPEVCTYCGLGYELMNFEGKCSTCRAVFGQGCATCTESRCTSVLDENVYKIVGAVAVAKDKPDPTDCKTIYPGCDECTLDNCSKCHSKAELDDGFCKYKIPTCESGQKTLYIKDEFTCGTCETFDANCVPGRCSGRACTMCKTGYTTTAAGGCMNCSSTYTGCAVCQEDACTKCRTSSWILTPNGCFNQNPYVPPEESKAGMIAGIVVGVVVLVVIIVLAIYCIVTSSTKYGHVDPSMYEDDLEFNSQSAL